MTDVQLDTGRTERSSGGENRTPRSEITSQRKNLEGWKYEPAWLLDVSPSMFWGAEDEEDRSQDWPSPKSRRAIVLQFAPLFIGRLAGEDSEAAKEALAAGGDPDKSGGVFTVVFSNKARVIGDLNEANVVSKLESDDTWTGEGTNIAPGIQLAIDEFDEEFAEDEPGITRVHEINITTDGEAQDWEKALPYLKAASKRRIYNVMILGHGDKAKRTYDAYMKAAAENQAADPKGQRHVQVALFDAVTDPIELAEDGLAMVGLLAA
jgi:hypothetical protein